MAMHIFFSGIGGTAIGPLALIARQAGHSVSGSDKQDSEYVHYLKKRGLDTIYIGQSGSQIEAAHRQRPIDWYVYSSAVAIENANSPELQFCRRQGIKTTKRDGLINFILTAKKLRLIAVAGTHGKTTTTAMIIWLFKQLGIPISYSVGAKISFGDMGHYDKHSEYFVYECDEFDRNFLAFWPQLSVITGVTWDHHEIYPTPGDYQQAFRDFISQSARAIIWKEDAERLSLSKSGNVAVLDGLADEGMLSKIAGHYNRLDAWLAIQAVRRASGQSVESLVKIINSFPGLQRRMEEIAPGLYSDYAHTPEKIRAAMSVALELAARQKQNVAVVYEPLTNRRQHYMIKDYQDCFMGAKKVYWLPSYLAREDPRQRIIPPEELISRLSDPSIAEARERDKHLKQTIQQHLDQGDMVVGVAGGGGGSLDEWLRRYFAAASKAADEPSA